jgi:23S rRNA (uracil1939-C5)-methyltransferase
VEFLVGRSEDIIPDLYKKGIKGDIIVVDLPRKGCGEELLQTIAAMKPQRVVYISCDLGILSRDLKYLLENGLKVVEAQLMDMFLATAHVECVVRIERK